MDPLSITAAAVGFLGASAKVVKTCSRFKKGGQEVRSLQDGVQRHRLLIDTIAASLGRSYGQQRSLNVPDVIIKPIDDAIHDSTVLMQDIDQLLQYKLLTIEAEGETQRPRKSQYISCHDTIQDYLQRLGVLRETLRDHQQILICCQISQLKDRLTISSPEAEGNIGVAAGSIASSMSSASSSANGASHAHIARSSSASGAQTVKRPETQWKPTKHHMQTILSQLRDGGHKPTPLDENGLTYCSPSSTSPELTAIDHGCGYFCPCRCHKFRMTSMLPGMASVIGTLQISARGSLWQACNVRSCKGQRAQMQTKYRLPVNLWMKSLHFVAQLDSFTRLTACIVSLNIVQWDSPCFDCIRRDSVVELRALLQAKNATIYDADRHGMCLLQCALMDSKFRTANFLTDQGAVAGIEDISGMSAMGVAVDLFLAGVNRWEVSPVLLKIVGDDFQDGLELTQVHRSVLGFSRVALEEILKDPLARAEIDQVDTRGFTALCQAAARKDDVAVRILLEYGADPTIANTMLRTPLHFAAEGALETLELLLQAGSEINLQDKLGDTALMSCCAPRSCTENDAQIKILLDYGANDEIRAAHGHEGGWTAFMSAAFAIEAVSIRCLLDHRPIHCLPMDQQNFLFFAIFPMYQEYDHRWKASDLVLYLSHCWYADSTIEDEKRYPFHSFDVNEWGRRAARKDRLLWKNDDEIPQLIGLLADKIRTCRASTRNGGPVDGRYPRNLPKCAACLAEEEAPNNAESVHGDDQSIDSARNTVFDGRDPIEEEYYDAES